MIRVDKDGVFPNSFKLTSRASFVAQIKSKGELVEAFNFAKKEGLPLLPVGEGTNITPKPYVKALAALLSIPGLELNSDFFSVSAGEHWDNVVALAVKSGLSGIEALSAIPGKAGASPVQNIGAYGTEMKDVVETVEIFDTKTRDFKILRNKDCKFEYRDSLFKRNPGRFIITNVTLKLSRETPKIPDYKDVKKYFSEKAILAPSLQEIRKAIIEIRSNKLPDPNTIPNCGSFFKNPIVSKEIAEKIKKEFPNLQIFEKDGMFKIPAGFLIDSLGFKGKRIGNIEIYKNNALVLTNPYRASFSDLLFAKSEIEKAVFQRYSIELEPEVNIVE